MKQELILKQHTKGKPGVLLSSQSAELAGVPNARELGGYMSSDGRQIKRGRLIRSGQLCGATAGDKRRLSDMLKNGLVIDFRSPCETDGMPEKIDFGAEYINLPILDDTIGGKPLSEIALDGETELYSRILFGVTAKSAYKRFFGLLLESGGEKPVLFHSVYGKDRTGVAAAILLKMLGIPDETIIEDYLLTNKVNARTVQVNGEQIEVASYIDGMRMPETVFAHSLEYLFSVADVEYGSVVGYIEEICGLSEADIEELKNNFLV